MPTIDTLMQGKQLGTIIVTRPGWGNCWFRPYYQTAPDSGKQWWYGLREDGRSNCYRAAESGWELWQEPHAAGCEDCEKLRKERDDAVGALDRFMQNMRQLGFK